MQRIVVRAPLKTKDVLQFLRDWEPEKDIRYTLVKRKNFLLEFEVNALNGYQAVDLARKGLKSAGLADLPDLDISVLEEEEPNKTGGR